MNQPSHHNRQLLMWAVAIGFTALYTLELICFYAASVHGGEWLIWFGAICMVSAMTTTWYVFLTQRRAIRPTIFLSILVALAFFPALFAIAVLSLPWYQPGESR